MCGITAFFSTHHAVSSELLKKATQTLHHRGPDSQKTWISPRGNVGLGHTRLSIIDLNTGTQPLSSENGQIHAVVNGELYGFQEIRETLKKRGHNFKTKSDSEIVIPLYQDLGAQCVHELRGEFAFVIWDENQQTLFAARDRFGIKPLYYAKHQGTLYFASEVKALFAAGVPVRWDMDSFFHANQLWTTTQDRTLFEGVFAVPPGHYLIATRNSFQILPYWDFNYPIHDKAWNEKPLSDSEAIEEFSAVLNESVKLRLHADVPVGCYLSGGLDSCAILGLAAKHSPNPVQAFTIGFDHDAYDESAIAKEMAEKAGAKYLSIPVEHDGLADHFSDAVWHSETLLVNPHGIAKYMLSEAVRNAGYKVVLTGEGSDEVLAGYPHFRRDLLLYQSPEKSPEVVRSLLHQLTESNTASKGILVPFDKIEIKDGINRVLGYMPTWIEAYASTATLFESIYSDAFRENTKNQDIYRQFLNGLAVHDQLRGRDQVHQSMYLWSKSILPGYILTVLGDRMEMAHSVEGRVPFLDHKLVETARKLPTSLKIRDLKEKFVLREAAKSVLTDQVYNRQKHPFLAPPVALNHKSRMYEMLRDTVQSTAFGKLPFFNREKVLDAIEKAPKLDRPSITSYDRVFCHIMSAYFLQERFQIG